MPPTPFRPDAFNALLGERGLAPFRPDAFNALLEEHGLAPFTPGDPQTRCPVADAMAHVESRVQTRLTFDIVARLYADEFGTANPAVKSEGIPAGSMRTAAGDIYARVLRTFCTMTRAEFGAGILPARIDLDLGTVKSWYEKGARTGRLNVVLGRAHCNEMPVVLGIDGKPSLVPVGVLGFYCDARGPLDDVLGLGCVPDDTAPAVEGKVFYRKPQIGFAAPFGVEAVYVVVRFEQAPTVEALLASPPPR